MSLTLRIHSYRKQAPALPTERRFDQLGGTLGRAAGNGLELPDPGYYISRLHGKIEFLDGRYSLTDVGRNPSWINGRPLADGERAELKNGDQLQIGDYVLTVHVEAAAPDGARDALALDNILDVIGGFDPHAADAANDPLGLNLLERDVGSGSASDHVAPQFMPMQALRLPSPPSVSTPAPAMLIPDDYDPLADFLPPRLAPSTAAADHATLSALMRGMGLADTRPARPDAEIAAMAGAMLREACAGAMALLAARAVTKRDARLAVTQLGEQANNPLKFFADAEAALAHMLVEEQAGYLAPIDAISAAFEDMKCHEMALRAGVRAALSGVLRRFDPSLIEAAMGPPGALDKLFGERRKAAMWDRMVALHADIEAEAEYDFRQLFGDRFGAAYEAQIGADRQ
ncbi:type VI secretion system FHA domain protein [Oxalobacteraceae bacterium GrIS 1.11]